MTIKIYEPPHKRRLDHSIDVLSTVSLSGVCTVASTGFDPTSALLLETYEATLARRKQPRPPRMYEDAG